MSDQLVSAESPARGLTGAHFRDHLRDSFERQVAPDFSLGEPGRWIKVIDEWLAQGRIEPARYALVHLREQKPDLEWSQTVFELVDRAPEATARSDAFVDDPDSDLQVVPLEGARTVVFAFTGRGHRLNMPLWLFHRWMARLDASVVYVRDLKDRFYLDGIASCGSFEATVERFREICSGLNAGRILCLGNCSGGNAALRFGLKLGAERVFAFSSPFNLDPEFTLFLNRRRTAILLTKTFPGMNLDLRPLYLGASKRPETVLFYGDKCWDDRIQNEHMAGIPGLTLAPVRGYPGHGALPELIQRGEFGAVLQRLVAPDAIG